MFEEEDSALTNAEKRCLENLKAIKTFLRANYPNWPSRDSNMTIRKMAHLIVKHLNELAQSGQMSCEAYGQSAVRSLFSNQNSPANRIAKEGHIDPFWRS